jgi:hypothetical protein
VNVTEEFQKGYNQGKVAGVEQGTSVAISEFKRGMEAGKQIGITQAQIENLFKGQQEMKASVELLVIKVDNLRYWQGKVMGASGLLGLIFGAISGFFVNLFNNRI